MMANTFETIKKNFKNICNVYNEIVVRFGVGLPSALKSARNVKLVVKLYGNYNFMLFL